jgi:DNA-binding transcriptional ArsR family regulator
MRTKRGILAAIHVLANPIAYRILAAIGMRGPQTTGALAGVLVDVPVSSLYRQLTRLRDAGILRVTSERQARGAVERTYALASRDSAAFAAADFAKLPVSQVRAALRNFIATMVADVSAYVDSRAFARDRSRLNAALAVLKLTDDEYTQAMKDVQATLTRVKAQSTQSPQASQRYFYLVALPELATP